MIAFTRQIAIDNAPYGVRANVILPGLIDTPMAVDTRVRATGKTREQISAERSGRVPMGRMGTGLDIGHASPRSAEHTSELQSLMRNSYAVFCLKKTNKNKN